MPIRPDRQGITEIRHVEGYLAYWDELLKRHPGMFIDTCASGGRRNDLETLRRAIPLWRTDYRCEPTGTQCCTYGISLWIPLSGTGAADVDAYMFRSNMVPFTNCLFDVRMTTLDYDLLRRLTAQWRKIADGYFGDFYPLTEYSTTKDSWMAWQFDRPETGEGFVQAFRREKCIFEVGRLRLRGLAARRPVRGLGSRYAAASADLGARTHDPGSSRDNPRPTRRRGVAVPESHGPRPAEVIRRRPPSRTVRDEHFICQTKGRSWGRVLAFGNRSWEYCPIGRGQGTPATVMERPRKLITFADCRNGSRRRCPFTADFCQSGGRDRRAGGRSCHLTINASASARNSFNSLLYSSGKSC